MPDLDALIRASLAWVYPNRLAIGLVASVALVALAVAARRRRWHVTARRHPVATAVVVLGLLAVTLPAAWYLGSPLLVRTTLEEPAPATAASRMPSPVRGTAEPSTPGRTGSSPAAPAIASPSMPRPLADPRTGRFQGQDDFHFGKGTATLLETAPGVFVVRFEEFSVRNGPDLYVVLSPDPSGYADGAVELGRLRATDGSFNVDVPGGVDAAAARSVVIWCRQFSVQFAVAPLE